MIIIIAAPAAITQAVGHLSQEVEITRYVDKTGDGMFLPGVAAQVRQLLAPLWRNWTWKHLHKEPALI